MFRFIAFAWNSNDPEQAACAGQLSQRTLDIYGALGEVLNCNGLVVHWAGLRQGSSEHYLLRSNQGVVLGQLFLNDTTNQAGCGAVVLGARATDDIVASNGRHLLRHYWGRYVAFLRDTVTGATRVIRDPTGALPCFVTSIGGVSVFFSRVEDCVHLGAQFTVNWDYVLAQLATAANERLDGTGLNEIAPVHGGECVERRGDQLLRQFYWNPFAVANENVIDNPVEAARELRQTVRSCVHSWASCYDGIALRLSGGLDSSIVASCLADAPTSPRVTCFNHFSPGAESDERRYARLMAKRAGYALVEHERSHAKLSQLRRLIPHPHPLYARYSVDYGHYEAMLARESGARAIFSGEWGDAVFHSAPQEMQSAMDCARLNGIGIPLLRAALDTARLEGKLYWHVLGRSIAVGRLFARAPDPRQQVLLRHRPLLAPDAKARAANDDRYLHPWLKVASSTPPGKRWHIYESTLLDMQPFYGPIGYEDDPEQVAPLNSQPIIELCLRIPTYVLVMGGWDRAIARRAFLDDLPREIATRRTKGGVAEYQQAAFIESIEFVRELLLGGLLVSSGLLKRSALEDVLSGGPTRVAASIPELYWYVCTEAWLSQWPG